MANPSIEKISISLPAEQVRSMQQAVQSGRYATTSEVVREALRAWEDKEFLRLRQVDEIRRLLAEADASGPPAALDIEEVIAEAKRRHAAKKQNGDL